MYANVTNYENDETLEATQETICGRSGRHTYIVFVERGTSTGVAIPQRGTTLDMSKVAAAQAQAAQITSDLADDKNFFDADKIAEAQASISWIMAQFGK